MQYRNASFLVYDKNHRYSIRSIGISDHYLSSTPLNSGFDNHLFTNLIKDEYMSGNVFPFRFFS